MYFQCTLIIWRLSIYKKQKIGKTLNFFFFSHKNVCLYGIFWFRIDRRELQLEVKEEVRENIQIIYKHFLYVLHTTYFISKVLEVYSRSMETIYLHLRDLRTQVLWVAFSWNPRTIHVSKNYSFGRLTWIVAFSPKQYVSIVKSSWKWLSRLD